MVKNPVADTHDGLAVAQLGMGDAPSAEASFGRAEAAGNGFACGEGEQREFLLVVGERLAAMIENLHGGAERDRGEENDDQDGDGASQQRFGIEQAPIGGTADEAGQSAGVHAQ